MQFLSAEKFLGPPYSPSLSHLSQLLSWIKISELEAHMQKYKTIGYCPIQRWFQGLMSNQSNLIIQKVTAPEMTSNQYLPTRHIMWGRFSSVLFNAAALPSSDPLCSCNCVTIHVCFPLESLSCCLYNSHQPYLSSFTFPVWQAILPVLLYSAFYQHHRFLRSLSCVYTDLLCASWGSDHRQLSP